MRINRDRPTIFVFGSNESGHHGAGAAKTAFLEHGALMGNSYGHHGRSFAVPTVDKEIRRTLSMKHIEGYVRGLLAYALSHPEWDFKVTRLGCGLAGLKDQDVAPLFDDHPPNCFFDEAWRPWLGDEASYWGTFP